MNAIIYALIDPNTFTVRYVGKTEKSLNKRLKQHIYESREPSNHRHYWINSLLKQNQLPIIYVLEECNIVNWEGKEKYWIDVWKKNEAKLTNGNEGGRGGSNPTAETRKKISDFHKGTHLSLETRKKIGNAHRGMKRSPETRAKMSAAELGKKKIIIMEKITLMKLKKKSVTLLKEKNILIMERNSPQKL